MVYRVGKWPKYQVLAQSTDIQHSLPYTLPLSEETLQQLLYNYGQVVLKPTGGAGGAGVIKVSMTSHRRYSIHDGQSITSRPNFKSAFAAIRGRIRKASYLVQQYIVLATIDKRPFDLRIMVQKSKKGNWVITGRLAKVAGRGYMITNTARSRGRVLPVSTAIRRSNIRRRSRPSSHIVRKVDHLALRSSRQLQQRYRKLRTIGIDIGVDSGGKPWLIEANFIPSKSLFKRLKDRTMYHRIIRYSRFR